VDAAEIIGFLTVCNGRALGGEGELCFYTVIIRFIRSMWVLQADE